MGKHVGKMTLIPRPRDSSASARSESCRTLESYRRDGEWVVEAIDDAGRCLFTHYGAKPMSRKEAVKLAKNWVPA